MTIHHATAKKAVANGVSLKELHDNDYIALWADRNIRIHRNDPKDALADMLAIKNTMAEYRGVKIIQDENGTFSMLKGSKAVSEGEDVREVIAEGLEALFGSGDDTAEEDSEETEGEEDSEETEGEEDGEQQADEIEDLEEGSIVKSKYREEYKARGTPTNCNDWLAQQYAEFAMSEKPATTREVRNAKTGKVRTVKVKARLSGDADKHYAIARANDVTKTWPDLNPGQQCMNSRNMVRAVVMKTGKLVIPARLTGGRGTLTLKAEKD